MNRFFFIIAGTLFLGLTAEGSVTIVENTPSRLVFKWELPRFDSSSIRDSGKLATYLGFSGQNIALGSAGEPVVPGHSVYVGIPSSGTIRVSFNADRVQTIRLKHPLRKYPLKGDGMFRKKQVQQFVDDWVSEPSYTWFKTLRAAQLVIRPFLPAGDRQTVRVLRSGECTIDFPPAAPGGIVHPVKTPYQKMEKRLLLNYDIASAWVTSSKSAGTPNVAAASARGKSGSTPAAKAALGVAAVPSGSLGKSVAKMVVDPYPLTYGDPTLRTFTIGDGHAGQNEMSTNENGILMITGAQILHLWGSQYSQIGIGQVTLYASTKGEMSTDIPGAGAIPAGVQEVPLFRCDRNGNGVVDSGDFFLAWVTGLNDWVYDSSHNNFAYAVDNYDDNRHYWLCYRPIGDGASMPHFSQPAGSGDTVGYFTNHACFGQPVYRLQDVSGNVPAEAAEIGYSWVQISLNNSTWNYQLNLPGFDSTVGGALQFNAFAESFATVNATIGGTPLFQGVQSGQQYPVSRWGNCSLQLQYADHDSAWFQLESIQADYRHPLHATSDTVRLQAFSACSSGVQSYRFTGGTGTTYVFRIPLNESAVSLIDTFSAGAPVIWSDSGNTGARYFLCNAAGFSTLPNTDSCFSAPPARLGSTITYALPNCRNAGNQATYLIVTHPAFLSQAEALAAHKAKMGFRPGIVSINDIYTDFSGGNTDPVALRNFLAYANRNWATSDSLDYVVLLGNGDYDFKQIATSEVDYIPPAEVNDAEEDEFYAILTPGGGQQSIALGRIPCQTVTQAQAVIDKIIATEDPQKADWSSWRNSALFIADDDMQLKDVDPIGSQHMTNCEQTSAAAKAGRPSLAIEKVYEFEYPTNSNYEKPECASALINAINNGVGYVCFYGHGSPVVWTDEHIMTIPLTARLSNSNQYPFITEFSCSEGEFDIPDLTTLSQALLDMPGAGAIATFAASRSASSEENDELGISLFSDLFDTLSEASIGMAMIEAKAKSPSDNTSLYSLLGDPSITLVPRCLRLQAAITDTNGIPHDTLQALEQVEIAGQVLDSSGNPDVQFGSNGPAYVHLGIFNPNYLTGRTDGGSADFADSAIRFQLPGTPVFSGTASVNNGKFKQTALLPRSLTFDTDSAQLLAYAWEGPTTGVAFNNTLYFHGTVSSRSTKDSVGPQISIRPLYDMSSMNSGSVSFTGPVESSLPLQIQILLSSPNGINVIGTGPDEGLTMAIPGVESQTNINSKFQFAAGDYRKGSAIIGFESGSLKAGTYPVTLTAQDLLGNISRLTFSMKIDDSTGPIGIYRTFNTPNPMRMGQSTRFFWLTNLTATQNTNPPATGSFTIKIYSLSGRVLKVIQNAQIGEAWNGRDQTGYVLPPDVYLYQVAAAYQNTELSNGLSGSANVKGAIQKLVIYPPR